MNKNFGIVEDIIELGAYVFGDNNIPRVPFQPNGDWEPYLPKYEPQAENFETSGCTVWGSQNQIETFIKRVYGYEPNYSERFTYLLAGIQPQKGTDPQNTYETIRRTGLIDNKLMPVTDTLKEFLDKTDLTYYNLQMGQEWLKEHEFKHQWLWTERPEGYMDVLKEGLKSSPLGVSVSAWQLSIDKDGVPVYVSNQGSVNNHFCLLYKIDKDGYPWVFDSYDHSKKRLAKDHNIRRAKLIYIQKKTRAGMKLHLRVLQALVNLFVKKKPMIHPVGEQCPVTQAFGVDSDHYQSGMHNGTDYACPLLTPVYAPTDGEITHTFKGHPSLGNAIHFMCDGGEYYMRFLHLSRSEPKGKYTQGEIIGYTGNTGDSEGPHLHVDVWKVPINTGLIKTKSGVFNNLVDPELFFNNKL